MNPETLIAELDKSIDMLRTWWGEAKPDSKEKDSYRQRIDQMLDERIRLMKLRDNP